jgi:hypothetical protein
MLRLTVRKPARDLSPFFTEFACSPHRGRLNDAGHLDVKPQTPSTMTCMELAQQIEKFQPGASPQEVARLCLLLTNTTDDLAALREQRALRDAWKRTGLQLQVATDQHAAMTEELEALAASDPQSFDQEQIWVLIRAIKVQSQVLQMYVGHPLIDV